MQVLAYQLHFLPNRNAELAIPPLFWPVNCIKIGRHVALLSDRTVYSLYCVIGEEMKIVKKRRTLKSNLVFKTVHSSNVTCRVLNEFLSYYCTCVHTLM